MKIKNTQWLFTDPDNLQFGYIDTLNSGLYIFKEFDRVSFPEAFEVLVKLSREQLMKHLLWNSPECWIQTSINVHEYTLTEMHSYVQGYYDGLDEIIRIYENNAEFIIAEIIFEQTSGLYP